MTSSERVVLWRKKNPGRHNSNQRKYGARLKAIAIKTYGGFCLCCGETDPRFLTIDHINGDGASHRRLVGHGGRTFYLWLKTHKYPEGFRTLCYNCNCGRERNGGVCPHEETVKQIANL